MLHGHPCRPSLQPHWYEVTSYFQSAINEGRKTAAKMPLLVALGQILVVRRFACSTSWPVILTNISSYTFGPVLAEVTVTTSAEAKSGPKLHFGRQSASA